MKRLKYWLPPTLAGGVLLLLSAPLGYGVAGQMRMLAPDAYPILLQSSINAFQILGVLLVLAGSFNFATRNSSGSPITIVIQKQG